jgi:hypothetical protein
LGVLEDAAVAMLPDHPGDEQGHRRKAFVHGLGHALPSGAPPVYQGGVVVRWPAGKAQPSEDLVPDPSNYWELSSGKWYREFSLVR